MWDKIVAMEFAKVPTGMTMFLVFFLVVFIMILWNIQRDKDNQVDIKDLICRDGRIDEGKFMRFTAFIVSTWGFIYLIIDERFSEWYFAGYMAAWAGNALVGKYLSLRAAQIDGTTPPPNNNSANNSANTPPSAKPVL